MPGLWRCFRRKAEREGAVLLSFGVVAGAGWGRLGRHYYCLNGTASPSGADAVGIYVCKDSRLSGLLCWHYVLYMLYLQHYPSTHPHAVSRWKQNGKACHRRPHRDEA